MNPRTLSSTLLALAACTAIAFAASASFTFVVLGDRTGSARHDVFCQVIDEVKLLHPDLILSVGDLIEGYTDNLETVNTQWNTIQNLINSTGIPFYQCPGNHDIFDAQSESVYVSRVGKPCFSLQYANALFIFLDNSRSVWFGQLPEAQKRWFRSELRKARDFEHSFVLMHRPFWRYAREKDEPDSLHIWCREAGIKYVLTGHDHFYCSAERDGIRYFQVGPSGSRYKVYHDPAQGAFQNYLFGRVVGKHIYISVIEPGSLKRPDVVTYDALSALDRAREKAVEIKPLTVTAGTALSAQRQLRIHDIVDAAQHGRLAWDYKTSAWQVSPGSLSFRVGSGASCLYQLGFRLKDPDNPYPLPVLSLPYQYAPGRSTELHKVLSIRRKTSWPKLADPPGLDGVLDDSCWQFVRALTGFGSRTGAASPIEKTELWTYHDDSLIYFAVRCHESRMDRIAAAITERDDKVYKDDHINIVFDPNRAVTLRFAAQMDSLATGKKTNIPESGVYYQVFVNSIGTIADRKCWLEGEESTRDYSWDGNWQVAACTDRNSWTVEMSCPLADFGQVGSESGINVVRFQSRFDNIGVWQVPFKHDPRTFGILTRRQ